MSSDPALRAQKMRDRLARKLADRELQAQVEAEAQIHGQGQGQINQSSGQTTTGPSSSSPSPATAAAAVTTGPTLAQTTNWCEQRLALLLADAETFATIRWNNADFSCSPHTGQETILWSTVMTLLFSTFEECWSRWMMTMDSQQVNRNGKCMADKTALACVRRSKEKFGQLRERVEQAGLLDRVILEPARLGVRKMDAAARNKMMGTLQGRPRSERRVAEMFRLMGGPPVPR